MKHEIKHRITGAVLFSGEYASLRVCVEAAVRARANLVGANLARADLVGANLARANLAGANLARANLAYANLAYANLARANLAYADLVGADLAYAYLAGFKMATKSGAPLVAFGERPHLSLGPLGSRNEYLQAWFTDQGAYVRAGCFWDTLAKFAKAVKKRHPKGIHAREYAAAIALIRVHTRGWKK